MKTPNPMPCGHVAGCHRCGGWTGYGGMSQYADSVEKVHGRTGCFCVKPGLKLAIMRVHFPKVPDKVQFARLIDEMMAALDGSTVTKMIADMATSMDLSIGEVNKLLDHAVATWEAAKPAA